MNTRILIFGDSITWGALDEEGGWADRIKRNVDKKLIADSNYDSSVYVLGVSGDTTEDLLKRIDIESSTRIDNDNPLTMLIAIGINDSQILFETGKNKISPTEFHSNLEMLMKIAKKYAKNIALIGLTPVIEERANSREGKNHKAYLVKEVEKYEELLKQFTKQNNLDFIEVYDDFQKEKYEELLPDGLHPNSSGHEIIYNKVIEYLEEKKWA